jgi:outer membrane immunogenic protein
MAPRKIMIGHSITCLARRCSIREVGRRLRRSLGNFTPGECADPFEINTFNNDAASLDDPHIPFSGQNQSGGVVGGFFGVQKQWGSWVLGLEGSVDYAHISNSTSGGFTQTTALAVVDEGNGPSGGRLTEKSTTIGQFTSTIDTIGAVNAKVGYAFSPNWMIYGTGGMAFAHEKNSFSFSNSLFQLDCDTADATECDIRTGFVDPGNNFDGFTRFANSSFAGSGGTTMFGWTAGAGIDYKWQLDPGSALVFGIDYKHYGFGHHTLSVAGPDGGTFSVDSTQDIDVIKGRISYLFSIH